MYVLVKKFLYRDTNPDQPKNPPRLQWTSMHPSCDNDSVPDLERQRLAIIVVVVLFTGCMLFYHPINSVKALKDNRLGTTFCYYAAMMLSLIHI